MDAHESLKTWLMIVKTCFLIVVHGHLPYFHISQVTLWGGAHGGGAPGFNDQNSIHFKKIAIFELKNASEAIGTPPHERPSRSLENVSFFQNWGKSMSFIGQYKANAPPYAPHDPPLKSSRSGLKKFLLSFFMKMGSLGCTDPFSYKELAATLW